MSLSVLYKRDHHALKARSRLMIWDRFLTGWDRETNEGRKNRQSREDNEVPPSQIRQDTLGYPRASAFACTVRNGWSRTLPLGVTATSMFGHACVQSRAGHELTLPQGCPKLST